MWSLPPGSLGETGSDGLVSLDSGFRLVLRSTASRELPAEQPTSGGEVAARVQGFGRPCTAGKVHRGAVCLGLRFPAWRSSTDGLCVWRPAPGVVRFARRCRLSILVTSVVWDGVSSAETVRPVTFGCRSCCECSTVPVVVTFGVHDPETGPLA